MSNDLGPYTQNLEQMIGQRWNPQSGQHGKHVVLYGIALDLLTECSALRATEHNLLAEIEKVRNDAKLYWRLRSGSNWPAVFESHDAPEPLRGDALDAAMKGKE